MSELAKEILTYLAILLVIFLMLFIPLIIAGMQEEQQTKERQRECIEKGGMWVETKLARDRHCIYDYREASDKE